MFGDPAGARYDVPIQALFDMAAEGPADTGNYKSRILDRHIEDLLWGVHAEGPTE